MELSMSKTNTVSPLHQRMIEDMAARKLNPHTQRSHIYSCERFAAWLKRSHDTATADEVRRFQLYFIESGASICNRNRIMTGVRFLVSRHAASPRSGGRGVAPQGAGEAVLLRFVLRQSTSILNAFRLALIGAGALGNALDRLRLELLSIYLMPWSLDSSGSSTSLTFQSISELF
jgi:hypothetical protein